MYFPDNFAGMICTRDMLIIRLLVKLIPSKGYQKGIRVILVTFQTEIRDEMFILQQSGKIRYNGS